MTHDQITKALVSLAPGAEWTLTGDDYDTLVWLSDGKAPTLAQIKAEIDSFPAKELAKEAQKVALYERLGITEDEAKLLLG